MGTGFRWLLGSSWASNIGDGVALAAGPLLVASLTSNAFLVALAALLQRFPWLVLGLYAGAIADRVDRRRLVMASDAARAVVLAVLAIGLSIWLVRTLRRSTDRWTIISLSLVLGGALGNLSDRIFRSPGFLRGHVVDFVKVGSFPSFNVADSAITCGAILLILLSFRPTPRATGEGDAK